MTPAPGHATVQHLDDLLEGYRLTYAVEHLVRRFLQSASDRASLDLDRLAQEASSSYVQERRPRPLAATIGSTSFNVLDTCTFGELTNILFEGGLQLRPAFSPWFDSGVGPTLRAWFTVALDVRNAIAHFHVIHRDSLSHMRELGRLFLQILRRTETDPAWLDQMEGVIHGQSPLVERREDTRRRMDRARAAVPHPSVIVAIARHLEQFDAETASILELPTFLASLLDLRMTLVFRQNATQAFKAALEATLLHEVFHHARPGEEGTRVARLLVPSRSQTPEVGTLVYTDADHPAIRHMAESLWPSRPRELPILDILMRGDERDAPRRILERLNSELDAIDPTAVLLPHVAWMNGAVLDVVALTAHIRARHPLSTVIVDGAQAVGHIPLAVEECSRENPNIDFYVGCGHKWLGGPETVGFMRVGRRFHEDCPQCQQLLAASDQFTDASGVALSFRGEQSGTSQRGLARGMLRALHLFREGPGGIDGVYARIRRNADALRVLLMQCPSTLLLDPPPDMRSGIVSFCAARSGSTILERLDQALAAQGFQASSYRLPKMRNSPDSEKPFLRLSPGPDVTKEDLAEFHRILRAVTGER